MMPHELIAKIFSYVDLPTLLDNLCFKKLIYDAIPDLAINVCNDDYLPKFVFELGKRKEFRLLSKMIKELDKLQLEDNYLTFLDYDIVLQLLQYDRSLEDVVYNAIPAIVNLFYANETVRKITDGVLKRDLKDFMRKLTEIENFKLMKKLIGESIKIHPINHPHEDEEYDFFGVVLKKNWFLSHENSSETMQKYFELEPNYNWIYIGNYINSRKYIFNNIEIIQYWVKVLKAAINAKAVNIVKYFKNIWNEENRQYWIDLGDDIIISSVIEIDILLQSQE